MPGATSKYVLPYSVIGDTIASVAQSMQDLAGRTDLLLGEAGTVTSNVAANTTETKVIVLSRTYPGNNGAAVPGRVWVNVQAPVLAATGFNWWVNAWTGSASTITGFSINYQFGGVQASRVLQWNYIPYL